MKLRLALLLALLPLSLGAAEAAALTLAAVFSDHLVLQRGQRVPVWGWAAPGVEVTVRLGGQKCTARSDTTGRWEAQLEPLVASAEPHDLVVSSLAGADVVIHDVLVGDVWLCSGQSNMAMSMAPFIPWHRGVLDHEREVAAATHPTLRLFSVVPIPSHHPVRDVRGEWLTCSPATVAGFSGVAYYFGRALLRETGIPQGLVLSALGSTSIASWQRHPPFEVEAPEFDQQLADFAARSLAAARVGGKRPAFPPEPVPGYRLKPGACYQGMLAPLAPLGVRGVVWYQGESDSARAAGYADALRQLIAQFRADFRQENLPVYLVQLANHDAPRLKPDSWAELRDQQLAVFRSVPHTGLAVAADVGLPDQIHPPDKRTVGERLARWALADADGRAVVRSGPLAEAVRSQGRTLSITFSHVGGGLVARPGPALEGFALAGGDGVFHAATAVLTRDEVAVTSPAVAQPVRVRYAWRNNPVLSLWNIDGLPAPPFQLAVTPKAGPVPAGATFRSKP